MNQLGLDIVLAGLFLVLFSHVYGGLRLFSLSPVKGVLGLAVPGYLWIAAKRHNFNGGLFAIWLTGIVGVVIGTFILA